MNKTESPSNSPADEKKRAAARRRAVVMTVMTLVALGGATFAVMWLAYRYEHTVIANASVKGRVHRIGARIDGQVTKIEVMPGQRVSKGDVLIRLEDAHFQGAVRQAQSEFKAAQKRSDAERMAIDHEQRRLTLELERCDTLMQSATADLDAAKSSQERADREFDRTGTLRASGVASASEIDRISSDRDTARGRAKVMQAGLAVAEVNCRSARVSLDGLRVREAGLDVLAAEVERYRQQLSVAEANVAATVIRAPEGGWVAERIVEPGGSAKVGEPILLVWIGEPWVEAWADEKQLQNIQMGSSVDVALTAFPNRKFHGRVNGIGVLTDTEMDPTPVPSTLHSLFPKSAKVPIRIELNARLLRLQPGLTAVVGIKDSAESGHAAAAVAGFLSARR